MDAVEHALREILLQIGENPDREGLRGTPDRIKRSWETLYGGYIMRPEDFMTVFEDDSCEQMVVLKNIEMYSTCEHHMISFVGRAHLGYIPNGRVIGVSILARILEMYSRRLQIQERIGEQVTSCIMEYLQPLGAACIIEAQHLCMQARGVQKQNSVMTTSSLKGEFLKADVKAEFIQLIKL